MATSWFPFVDAPSRALAPGGINDISKYGITIRGSKLNRNTASYIGGALLQIGSFAGRKYAPTEITTSTISGNHAHEGGGLGFVQYGYNPSTHHATPPGQPITIDSSTISGNVANDKLAHPTTAHSFGGGI